MTAKIDISSTALEKGLDLAKSFLDKLILPSVEETGLLLKDNVTLWKFKNQVRMLTKAKQYCEMNRISPKTISLKLLCPLLDNAALEEDEILQDKWSILLSNLVDSEQNIENHVFPYILGQISTNEFLFLEKVLFDKKERIIKLNHELKEFRINRHQIEGNLKTKIKSLEEEIDLKKKGAKPLEKSGIWELQKTKSGVEWELSSLGYKEGRIIRNIKEPQVIPELELREFELSNLIRLGLIKSTQETTANSQTLEIPLDPVEYNSRHNYVNVDLDIDIESNIKHLLTELGVLFMDACTEKNEKTTPKKV